MAYASEFQPNQAENCKLWFIVVDVAYQSFNVAVIVKKYHYIFKRLQQIIEWKESRITLTKKRWYRTSNGLALIENR